MAGIPALMKEFGFEIDDVRWYLSVREAERLLTYRESPTKLAELVWSGTLGNDLYDMEERFLRELQENLDRNVTDEPHVREIFNDIETERRKRKRKRVPGA